MSDHDMNLTEREREIYGIGKTFWDGLPYDSSEDKKSHGGTGYTQIFTSDGVRIEDHPTSPGGDRTLHRHG